MELSGAEAVLAAVVVGLGALLQGSIGFGFALVAAPVLVFLDPHLVPGPLIVAGAPFMLLLAWRERGSMEFSALGAPLTGQLAGILLALAFLSFVDGRALSIAVALVVLLGAILSASGLHLQPTRRNFVLGGILAGFMGTTSSIPGPALALIHQHVSPARMRGALAPFFLVGGLVAFLGLVSTGQMRWEGFLVGLGLALPALIGLGVSTWTAPRVNQSLARPAVLIFATLASLGLLYRSI